MTARLRLTRLLARFAFRDGLESDYPLAGSFHRAHKHACVRGDKIKVDNPSLAITPSTSGQLIIYAALHLGVAVPALPGAARLDCLCMLRRVLRESITGGDILVGARFDHAPTRFFHHPVAAPDDTCNLFRICCQQLARFALRFDTDTDGDISELAHLVLTANNHLRVQFRFCLATGIEFHGGTGEWQRYSGGNHDDESRNLHMTPVSGKRRRCL